MRISQLSNVALSHIGGGACRNWDTDGFFFLHSSKNKEKARSRHSIHDAAANQRHPATPFVRNMTQKRSSLTASTLRLAINRYTKLHQPGRHSGRPRSYRFPCPKHTASPGGCSSSRPCRAPPAPDVPPPLAPWKTRPNNQPAEESLRRSVTSYFCPGIPVAVVLNPLSPHATAQSYNTRSATLSSESEAPSNRTRYGAMSAQTRTTAPSYTSTTSNRREPNSSHCNAGSLRRQVSKMSNPHKQQCRVHTTSNQRDPNSN